MWHQLAAAITDAPPTNDGIDPDIKRLFLGISFVGIFLFAYHGATLAFFKVHGQSLITAGLTLAWAANYAWLRATGRNYLVIVNLAALLIVADATAATLLMGGLASSAYVFVWALLGPIGVIAFTPSHRTWLWFAVYALLAAIVVAHEPATPPPSPFPPPYLPAETFANIFLSSALVILTLHQATKQAREERARAEGLLLNMLPKEIAAILKRESRVVADYFDRASVLFADIVGFTPMSANMDPVELVRLLNEIFSHFDVLVEKYDVEKIKTIGDCFMIASGVPRPRCDHAQALVRLALEMRDFVDLHPFSGGRRVRFRIGINSGAVVAGVIGKKKFIYDLWGDAVNVASRMESQAPEGAIQITDGTYRLIKDEFVCESRGVIDVKGKGPTSVWHVLRSL